MPHEIDRLEQMRHTGDPEADQVIKDLYESGDLGSVNEVLSTLVRNDLPPAGELPESVRKYLEQSSQLPDWADPAKIENAERTFMSYGVTGYGVLAHASLPECYVTPSIAEGLSTTQKLIKQAHRRVLETSQFVISVMSGGGLDPDGDGRGIRSAQKVRLLHASIRFLILHAPDESERAMQLHPMNQGLLQMRWNVEEHGVPISQSDLLRTLLTFSFVILRGWRTLGVRLDQEREEAYIHCWNVVGHIMGIDTEHLPQTYAESGEMFDEFKSRWQADTVAGRLLTDALLRFVKSQVPFFLHGIPPMLLRRLVGEETAALLGVKRPNPIRWCLNGVAILALRAINRKRRSLYEDMPSIEIDSEWISRRVLERISTLRPEWREDLFEMPTHLAEKWDLAGSGTEP